MHALLKFHCNLGIVFSLELQNSAEPAVQAGHCSRVRIENRDDVEGGWDPEGGLSDDDTKSEASWDDEAWDDPDA